MCNKRYAPVLSNLLLLTHKQTAMYQNSMNRSFQEVDTSTGLRIHLVISYPITIVNIRICIRLVTSSATVFLYPSPSSYSPYLHRHFVRKFFRLHYHILVVCLHVVSILFFYCSFIHIFFYFSLYCFKLCIFLFYSVHWRTYCPLTFRLLILIQ